MNKTATLYIFGFFAAALAIFFPILSWISPLTFVVVLPLGAIWIWKREGRSVWDLGFRFSRRWLVWLAIGLLVGLAIPVLFQTIQVLGGWITLSSRGEFLTYWISSFPAVLLKMILVVAVEEFVSRGFFLQAFSRTFGFRVAAVMSSFLWGIGHLVSMVAAGLAPGLIVFGLTTFLFWGITLCLSYVKANKSLWLPFGLHLGINLSFSFSVVGMFFIIQPNAPQWWIGHPAWSPESGLIGIIVWLILAVMLYAITGKDAVNRFSAN